LYQKSLEGKRIGLGLVEKALKEAKELGVKETLVLTYSPEFFKKIGFLRYQKRPFLNIRFGLIV